MPHRVLLTDYAWPDVDIERAILAEADCALIVAEATDADSLAALAPGASAIMTNWALVPDSVLSAAGENLRIVSRMGIGLDNIDIPWCTAHRVPVTNVPDYCVQEVAEHALALLLSLARKVAYYHEQTQRGVYDLQSGPPLRRVAGQTLGILGLGNIGIRLAEMAQALGLNVVATNRSPKEVPGVKLLPLSEMLAASDYVSINAPLTDATRGIIGQDELRQMKPSAYLINTARGGLIDHVALAAALEAGEIAGAALDVQVPEPPDLSQPPYNDPRVIVTPHAAFVSEESLENLRSRAARQVVARLRGEVPENVVNPEVLATG